MTKELFWNWDRDGEDVEIVRSRTTGKRDGKGCRAWMADRWIIFTSDTFYMLDRNRSVQCNEEILLACICSSVITATKSSATKTQLVRTPRP